MSKFTITLTIDLDNMKMSDAIEFMNAIHNEYAGIEKIDCMHTELSDEDGEVICEREFC